MQTLREAVPEREILSVVEEEIHVVDGVVVRAVDDPVEEPEIDLNAVCAHGTTVDEECEMQSMKGRGIGEGWGCRPTTPNNALERKKIS